eukprot:9003269-Pyramimonas_sp.AAC.1
MTGRVSIQEAVERDFTQQDVGAARREPAVTGSGTKGRTPLHLVPLFDGWGIARLAVGDLVSKLGSSRSFRTSSFVEHNREAAEAAARRWAAAPDPQDGDPPHKQIAED